MLAIRTEQNILLPSPGLPVRRSLQVSHFVTYVIKHNAMNTFYGMES